METENNLRSLKPELSSILPATTGISAEQFSADTVNNSVSITCYNSQSPPTSNSAINPFLLVEPPTQIYVGNRNKLAQIHNILHATRGCASNLDRTIAITGMGGIGKSELARNYASEFKHLYRYIAWIDSETESDLRRSFERVAKELDLSVNPRDLKDVAWRVYNCLNTKTVPEPGKPVPSALFIFDNAMRMKGDDDKSSGAPGIYEFIPHVLTQNCEFHVLITTQWTYWDKRIATVSMSELTVADTLNYFSRQFRLSPADYDSLLPDLGKLAELLQGYPLAIALAAANIDYSPSNDSLYKLRREIMEYVESFDKTFLTQTLNDFMPSEYKHTLATTWTTALNRLQKCQKDGDDGRCAMEILIQISLLMDPDIGFDVLTELCMVEDPSSVESMMLEQDAEVAVEKGVRLLERHALVTVNWKNHTVKAHRLVKNLIFMAYSDPECVRRVLRWRAQLSFSFRTFTPRESPTSCRVRIPWERMRELVPKDTEMSVSILKIILGHYCYLTLKNGLREFLYDLVLDSTEITRVSSINVLVRILKTLNLGCEITMKMILLLACLISCGDDNHRPGLIQFGTALREMSSDKSDDDDSALRLVETATMVESVGKDKNNIAGVIDAVVSVEDVGNGPPAYSSALKLEASILSVLTTKAFFQDLAVFSSPQVQKWLLWVVERRNCEPEILLHTAFFMSRGLKIFGVQCLGSNDTLLKIFKVVGSSIPRKPPGMTSQRFRLNQWLYWKLILSCFQLKELGEQLVECGVEKVISVQLMEYNLKRCTFKSLEISTVTLVLRTVQYALDCSLSRSANFEEILEHLSTFQCQTLLSFEQDAGYSSWFLCHLIWLIWMKITVMHGVGDPDKLFEKYFPDPGLLQDSKAMVMNIAHVGSVACILNSPNDLTVLDKFLMKTEDSRSEQVRSAREVATLLTSLCSPLFVKESSSRKALSVLRMTSKMKSCQLL